MLKTLSLSVFLMLLTGSQSQQTVRLIPPSGATFAPGQRFDVRIEVDGILRGLPQQISIKINGVDRSAEIMGNGRGGSSAPPRARDALNVTLFITDADSGSATRRNWSLAKPGKYEIEAIVVNTDGSRVSAKSTIDIVEVPAERQRAKNIILFIGDGMGLAQRTAARIVSCGVRAGRSSCWLNMDRMETYGLVATPSLDAIVTDSSPGASAYATGNKSRNNWHGVFPDNNDAGLTQAIVEAQPEVWPRALDNPRVENIAELLQRTRGMATGVVTTVSVTDATPAAFSSHAIRYAQTSIAEQLLQSGHNVILGAGSRFFLPKGDSRLGNIASARQDTRDIVAGFREAGYAFVSTATELKAEGKAGKLLGLFQPRDMASRYDRMRAGSGDPGSKEALGQFPDQPNLELMTQSAIDVLSRDPDGFVLMVEGGAIDRQYHMMDPSRAVFETIEFDKAIGTALAWAKKRPNKDTLVIVTADHETSGLAIPGLWEGNRIVYTGFPEYTDANKDGFPDTLQIERPLIFEGARTNPLLEGAPVVIPSRQFYSAPRNLRDLNPGSPMTQGMVDPPSANHTGTDIVISASGPGSHLFGGVIDNTDAFFLMLRALGYKPR